MSIIYFNYNKNLNYAIIYWIVEIILRGLIYLDWKLFKIYKKDSINEYFYLVLLNISDLLSVFLVIYIHCSIKRKPSYDLNYSDTSSSKSSKSSKSKIKLISEGNLSGFFLSKSFIYKIILICILDYLSRSTFFIFYQSNPDATHDDIDHKVQFDIINHIDIITNFILSYLMLKTKIFKHHILSFVIIIIGFILVIPTDTLQLHFFESERCRRLTYIYIGVFTFRGILFPLGDVIHKKVYIDNYILPEHLMLLKSLGGLLILLIITPILYFTIWINDDDSFTIVSDLTNMITLIIIYVSASFIKQYLLLKVIYYFSSQSVSFLLISESITGSMTEIINFFSSGDSDYANIIFLTIDIIIILLTSFGTLVYNEIIVIKKWGLDKNVAREITSRALLEVDKIKISDHDDEDDDDDEEEGDYDEEPKMVELNEKYD